MLSCIIHIESAYYELLIFSSNPVTCVRILKQCFKDQCFLNLIRDSWFEKNGLLQKVTQLLLTPPPPPPFPLTEFSNQVRVTIPNWFIHVNTSGSCEVTGATPVCKSVCLQYYGLWSCFTVHIFSHIWFPQVR